MLTMNCHIWQEVFLRLRIVRFSLFLLATVALSPACVPTGFSGLTAAVLNPTTVITGNVNATGCDIGVFYNSGTGSVKKATIWGALYYGVFVLGDNNNVSVDVLDSQIHDIGDNPFNGNQRGVAIYYRAYFAGTTATGKITGNTIWDYQKGGIVVNGPGATADVSNNIVTGFGPVGFIAQNGIQIGYGATAQVMRNTVTGHSYTGTSTVSGGIIVVGGPGYGICPAGVLCPFTTGTQIVGNTVVDNDIGIFLTNLEADFSAPVTPTNIKAVNNTVTNSGLHNNYGGFGYQAGVSDVGNNDKIVTNTIGGAGYDPAANPSAYTVAIDADVSFTNRPKVHANKVD